MAFDTSASMQKVVAPNYLGLRVGKKSKGVTAPLTQALRDAGGIYANRHRTNAHGFERIQISFYTPQLGVAEWSPRPTVEN